MPHEKISSYISPDTDVPPEAGPPLRVAVAPPNGNLSMTTLRMPVIYRPPNGGPLRWQDDVTGVLPKAVLAFLDVSIGRDVSFTAEQLGLVRDYCQYYINAPCWETADMESSFIELRERIIGVQTVEELDKWLHDCLYVGIDPL
jgi:hypothetical protein